MIWLVIIPIILAVAYTVYNTVKFPEEANKRVVRKIYYLLSVVWLVSFFIINNGRINLIAVTSDNFQIDNQLLNGITVVVMWMAATYLIDGLIISSRHLNSFKIKGVEFATTEVEDMSSYIGAYEEQKQSMQSIIKSEADILNLIKETFSSGEISNPETYYNEALEAYAYFRKAKFIFYEVSQDKDLRSEDIGENVFSSMKGKIKVVYEQSKIYNSIWDVGYFYDKDKKGNTTLALKIIPEYTRMNYYILFQGKGIYAEERFVVKNIIDFYENTIRAFVAHS